MGFAFVATTKNLYGSSCKDLVRSFSDIWWWKGWTRKVVVFFLLTAHMKINLIKHKKKTPNMVSSNVCYIQEDPRLKYPVYMRNKNSMEPGDLGPLPVSAVSMEQNRHLNTLKQSRQLDSRYF